MKELLPTFFVRKGSVTVAHMSMQVFTEPHGIPKRLEQQSVEEHVRRAKLFLNNYAHQQDPKIAIPLLSAALRSAVAAQKQALFFISENRAPVSKQTSRKRLDYQCILEIVRNAEEHFFTIPVTDGMYYVGSTQITGLAMLQLDGAKPRRWRKDGRIDTRKPVVLQVVGRRVFAFDESKSKCVELAFALLQYCKSLDSWLLEVFPPDVSLEVQAPPSEGS